MFDGFDKLTTYWKISTNIFTQENMQEYQMNMKKDLLHEVT